MLWLDVTSWLNLSDCPFSPIKAKVVNLVFMGHHPGPTRWPHWVVGSLTSLQSMYSTTLTNRAIVSQPLVSRDSSAQTLNSTNWSNWSCEEGILPKSHLLQTLWICNRIDESLERTWVEGCWWWGCEIMRDGSDL